MREYSTEQTQPKDSSLNSTVFTNEFFKEAFRVDKDINNELLENSAVRQHPTFTLEECLLSSTKDVLLQMAKEHGLIIPTSKKKNEVASQLKDHIIKIFTPMLEYLPTSNLNFLNRFANEKTTVIEASSVELMDISHTNHYGFTYLFKHNKKVFITIPTELTPSLSALKNKDLFERAHLHERVDAYAVSLSNLYGVLDIDQAAIVWNKYEKEDLTPMMIGDILSHLNSTQIFWWYEDENIISTYFDDDEEVEEFLQSVKDVSYYMPTSRELRLFFATPYDPASPAIHAMIDFLSTFSLDEADHVQQIMQHIADACVVGEELSDIIELLNGFGVYFHGIEEVTQFTQLYDDLEEVSRKWNLKGHRPSVLKSR